MTPWFSRRNFLMGAGGLALAPSLPSRGFALNSPFKIPVITDEGTEDFERALEISSHDFGLGRVELRELWGKNLMNLDEKDARKMVQEI